MSVGGWRGWVGRGGFSRGSTAGSVCRGKGGPGGGGEGSGGGGGLGGGRGLDCGGGIGGGGRIGGV